MLKTEQRRNMGSVEKEFFIFFLLVILMSKLCKCIAYRNKYKTYRIDTVSGHILCECQVCPLGSRFYLTSFKVNSPDKEGKLVGGCMKQCRDNWKATRPKSIPNMNG